MGTSTGPASVASMGTTSYGLFCTRSCHDGPGARPGWGMPPPRGRQETGRVSLRFGSIAHPLVYEVNTWAWLAGLGAAAGRRVSLGSVPDAAWDDLAGLGIDAVWLMGVWRRSPAGTAIALADPGLVASFRAALPDYRDEDVVGSPY